MDGPVLLVAGARPNFVKIAPIQRELDRRGVANVLVHTGQHYDAGMSDVFFDELGIRPPDESLGVGSGSHAVQTARIMEAFEPVVERVRPSWAVVVGDVNSTMACALVATKLHVRVAHVEAGLRSRDWSMPEEVNRVVTDRVSDLLLAPSSDGVANLRVEGVPDDAIVLVGNVMVDTLLANLDRARALGAAERLGLTPGEYAVLTLHRPSNVDDPVQLASLLGAIGTIARSVPVVYPVHPRARRSPSWVCPTASGSSIRSATSTPSRCRRPPASCSPTPGASRRRRRCRRAVPHPPHDDGAPDHGRGGHQPGGGRRSRDDRRRRRGRAGRSPATSPAGRIVDALLDPRWTS